jgi:hypothetical protein
LVLQLWKAFGNQQPAVITAIEKRLWTTMFDIASGETTVTITESLVTTLADISAMIAHDTTANFASWFMAGEILLVSPKTC